MADECFYVINRTSKKLLRKGFCDFTTDGSFDAVNEEIISGCYYVYPPTQEQDWYWNGTAFQTTPV